MTKDMSQFSGASVQGAAHKLHDKPNQDSFGGTTMGDWTVLCVSDGHGAARHFRSARGSRFAVMAAHKAIADLQRKRSLAALHAFPDVMIRHWRKLVAADVKADPLPSTYTDEAQIAYGATCLCFCTGPGFAFYAQIGDGDMVVRAGGGLTKPLLDDEGLIGEQTYSICQADAPHHFRVKLAQSPDALAMPAFVLLSSDGLSKSYRGDGQFLTVAQQLMGFAAERDMQTFSHELVPWLDDVSAHGVGDDTTVMIFKDSSAPLQVPAPSLAAKLKRFVGLK